MTDFLDSMTGKTKDIAAFISSVGFPVVVAIFLGVVCWVCLWRIAPAISALTEAVKANTVREQQQDVVLDTSRDSWIAHLKAEQTRELGLRACLQRARGNITAQLACVDMHDR